MRIQPSCGAPAGASASRGKQALSWGVRVGKDTGTTAQRGTTAARMAAGKGTMPLSRMDAAPLAGAMDAPASS